MLLDRGHFVLPKSRSVPFLHFFVPALDDFLQGREVDVAQAFDVQARAAGYFMLTQFFE